MVSAGSHGCPEVRLDWSIQEGSLEGLVLGAGCRLEAQRGLSTGASFSFHVTWSFHRTLVEFQGHTDLLRPNLGSDTVSCMLPFLD